MYSFFNQISNVLMQPFIALSNNFMHMPILFAFLLGIVGAMAPCQFTGNIGAITLYGNKSLQKETAWKDVFSFSLGKIMVFTLLGLLVWSLGNEFESRLTFYFPLFRKLVGPLFILVGFFLIGLFKLKGTLTFLKLPDKLFKKGKVGSFFLGVSFSLGFCPTMFVLFFVTLMPMVLSTPYGMVLPSLFAIGTSAPLFLAIFLIWYFEAGGTMLRKGRKVGAIMQKTAGIILILVGVLDTVTYWSI